MIGIFLGEQASGKTLSMVYYAYQYYKKGFRIYTNVGLSFKHEILSKEIIENFTKDKTQFDKAVFLIDEIYLFMDSRNFGRKSSKIQTYFLLQSSKRSVHVLATAQIFNSVEKRFRENSSFQCYCNREMLNPDGSYTDVDDVNRIVPSQNLYIRQNFLKRKVEFGIATNYTIQTFHLKASPVFALYDTKQLFDIGE